MDEKLTAMARQVRWPHGGFSILGDEEAARDVSANADNLYLVIYYLPYWVIPKGFLQTPLHTIAVDCSCLLRSSLALSPGKLGGNWGGWPKMQPT